jgi:DNA-binding NtrC family response regulator
MALVLIIDPSIDSLIHLVDIFQTNGFECRLASSWKMALEHLLIETFEAILCEFSIDDEDALWFIRHLETLKITSRYLIMSDNELVKKKISDQGFDLLFCLKPLDWDVLFEAINHH